MPPSSNNLVKSSVIMEFFGYQNRASFWHFIKTKGVPHIALNKRRVMFDPVALNNWLEKRSSNPAMVRKFVFDEPETTAQKSPPIKAGRDNLDYRAG